MILWKGTELRTKGIIVEKIPDIIKGQKNIKTYDIEGKNGLLVVDKGTYSSFVCTLDCHFDTEKYTINSIKEFLDGYGTLSFDGVTEYTAFVKNQIDFEKVAMFRKFPVQFQVNPISRDINATTLTITETPTSVTINSTANMYPTITLIGNGDLTITFNNKTFYLYDLDPNLTYTLDCDAKVIVNSNGVNCSNQMKYDFPYLQKGLNTISYTGTITQFKVDYKKAYI